MNRDDDIPCRHTMLVWWGVCLEGMDLEWYSLALPRRWLYAPDATRVQSMNDMACHKKQKISCSKITIS